MVTVPGSKRGTPVRPEYTPWYQKPWPYVIAIAVVLAVVALFAFKGGGGSGSYPELVVDGLPTMLDFYTDT